MYLSLIGSSGEATQVFNFVFFSLVVCLSYEVRLKSHIVVSFCLIFFILDWISFHLGVIWMLWRDHKGPFTHSEAIWLFVAAGIHGEDITYLSEFCSVCYHLGLKIYVFRCRLKDPKRWQAPSLHSKVIGISVPGRWDWELMAYLSEFIVISYHLGVKIHVFRYRLKDPKRRQGSGPPFKSYATICPRQVRLGLYSISQ